MNFSNESSFKMDHVSLLYPIILVAAFANTLHMFITDLWRGDPIVHLVACPGNRRIHRLNV